MKCLQQIFFVLTILLLSVVSVVAHETDTPHDEFSPCDPNSDYAEILKTRQTNTYVMYGFIALGILLVIMGKVRYNPLKHKIEKNYVRICRITFVIGIVFLLLAFNQLLRLHEYDTDALFFGLPGDTHEHADFKVYINNVLLNFSQEKYMTTTEKVENKNTHLHDMNGFVVHKHSPGVTWKYFFKTIGFELTKNCFITDEGKEYCNNEENRLLFFVNGKTNENYGSYEIKDLDRVLITYGKYDADNILQQLESITNESCISSGKCPERGDESLSEGCTVGG